MYYCARTCVAWYARTAEGDGKRDVCPRPLVFEKSLPHPKKKKRKTSKSNILNGSATVTVLFGF